MERVDLAIVGAGAAGLMAGIWAGRTAAGRRIVALESARRPGAKILIAGGGRCNVTHASVSEKDFSGAAPRAIRSVLRRFDVSSTIGFFAEAGVALKREETGKLFPTTDRARTVLDALLAQARAAGVELLPGRRVASIRREKEGFVVSGPSTGPDAWPPLGARRLILATGGMSLPKSGSDGHGYAMARSLGHSLTPRIFPALVPLLLPAGHFLTALPGLSAAARLDLRSSSGRRLARAEGPVLCTHFGLSGPAILDMSRHWIAARHDDPGATLSACWLAGVGVESAEAADRFLLGRGRGGSASRILREAGIPERLAAALCAEAGVEGSLAPARLPRESRRALARAVGDLPLPIAGDRGFTHAEVTAGGVPLDELRLAKMESRACDGLALCGEICAVDGRIGGFNFQWAWSSGYLAGVAAGQAIA